MGTNITSPLVIKINKEISCVDSYHKKTPHTFLANLNNSTLLNPFSLLTIKISSPDLFVFQANRFI